MTPAYSEAVTDDNINEETPTSEIDLDRSNSSASGTYNTEDFDDEYYLSTDDDDDLLNPAHQSSSRRKKLSSSWRKSYRIIKAEKKKEGANNNSYKDISLETSARSLSDSQHFFGGASDIGHSRHEDLAILSPKRLSSSLRSTKNDETSERNLNLSISSKLSMEDVATLQTMLAGGGGGGYDDDNEDDDGNSFASVSSSRDVQEPSFKSPKNPGQVNSKRQFFENMNNRQEEYDNEEEDEQEQLMRLQRQAEKARGYPSDYQSSDDEDDPLKDFEPSENQDGPDDDDDEECSDGDDENNSDTSSVAIMKQIGHESAKWEASVAAEVTEEAMHNSHRSLEGSSTHASGYFRRQKESFNSSLSFNNSNRSLIRSEHSKSSSNMDEADGNIKRKSSIIKPKNQAELREDLEAQVKARFQSQDEVVKREIEKSMARSSSKRRASSSLESLEEERSSLLMAMENGEAVKKDDKERVTLDVAPPIDEEEENKESGPLKKVANFMFSWAYIYFLVVFLFLLVVANVLLVVYFIRKK